MVRKVYVSSKFRKEGSSSNFRYELPIDIEPHQDTHIAVTDVIIPHSWYNVQASSNKFYFHEGVLDKVGTLDSGHYTASQLASALALKMNAVAGAGITYSVSAPTATTNRMVISQTGGSGFFVYSDADMMINGRYVDVTPLSNPQSINKYLNIVTSRAVITTYTTGLIVLIQTPEVFIRSPDMGLDTLDGNTGRRDILKKIPVDKPHGELIVSSNTFEASDLSKLGSTLRSFTIQLTDDHGNVIDLQNADFSFTLNIVESP